MKLKQSDIRILLSFFKNFDIINSDWGIDFIKRLEENNKKDLTSKDKLLSDWEE